MEIRFEKGEVVFHKSNTKQLMVIVSVTECTAKCRWITPEFKCELYEFFLFELYHNETPKNI